MKRLCGLNIGWTIAAIVAAIASAGCQKSAPVVAAARPTAEESYRFILDTFRRGIETGSGGVMPGLVTRQNGGGYTAVSVNNKVSDELIPPTKAGEPYRAKITVTSRSRYSRVPAGADGKTGRDDEAGAGDDFGATGDAAITDPTIDILEPGLIGSPGSARGGRRGPRGTTDVPLTRPAEEEVRVYELVYRNDRWELITEIDQKNDQAVQRAFEHALGTQI
ncbi:MAG: hypothetical protein WD669_01700 [Pirellulales bacterium]